MTNRRPLSRREFLQSLTVGIGSLVAGSALSACSGSGEKESASQPTESSETTVFVNEADAEHEASAAPVPSSSIFPTPETSAAEALRFLVEGNQRFVDGRASRPRQDRRRLKEMLAGQKPFAAILTCSDSRVPPEILFDQGLGDLFIVRTAGNVAGKIALGSLEYAVEHLGVALVVVLGHQKCGAVSAAVQGGEAAGHIASVIEKVLPAVEYTRGQPGDHLTNAINANIDFGVQYVNTSPPTLATLAALRKIEVVGARYDLDSGQVQWLTGNDEMKELFPKRGLAPWLNQPDTNEAPATAAAPARPAPAATAPASQPAQPTSAPGNAPAPAPATPAAATPAPNTPGTGQFVHIAQPGQTLEMIASLYGIDVNLLAQANGLTPTSSIAAGAQLIIPGGLRTPR